MLIESQNEGWHYDFMSKLLHWLLAILLIGLIALGLFMVSIEDQPNSGWYFNLHKSLGILAALLIGLRILWRLTHKPASLPKTVPKWQAFGSRFIHLLLYLCMIIMPLSGFMGSAFGKHGVAFFGWELPKLVENNRYISHQLFEIHEIVAWVLIALISLHIVASLKHLILNKDGVFQRMWW